MRRLGQRLARWAGLLPLRVPGLALAAAGAFVAFRVGQVEVDHVLYPAGFVAMGLVAVCALFVILGALAVRRNVRAQPAGVPDGVETQIRTRTTFRLPRLVAWPFVEVTLRWDEPTEVAVELDPDGRYWAESITPRLRGRFPRVVRRITVHDVFGLCAITFRVTWAEELRIAPQTALLGAELATSYAHGDAFSHPSGRPEGDLIEMRAYGHGDPMRHILWKTFARTRRLLVRMPERAIAPRPITVAFMVAGREDEPTASVARLYLERGLFGPDFLFAADGAEAPTGETHAAVEQVVDSARSRQDGGSAIQSLAAQIERARLHACVVFAPPVDGPWRERVTAFTRKLPAPATVIIGIDGDGHEKRRGLLSRVFLAPVPGEREQLRIKEGLPALRTALEDAGCQVQVIHRGTGQLA